jgi:uncharacterized membrane protein
MSKYNYFQKAQTEQKRVIHPVWYGIGCVMTIITPIISWAASLVLLDYGKSQNWPYLYQLSGTFQFPAIFYQIPLISIAANYISSIPYFEALVLFFILFLLVFSGFFSLLNAILYRMFGPPRYSSIDAPPPPRKSKRYTR